MAPPFVTRRLWPATVLAGVAGLCLGACQRDTQVIDRPVRLNSPKGCAVAGERGYASLYAHGDFEPTAEAPYVESLYLRDAAELAGLPLATKSLLADVSQPGAPAGFFGLARVPEAGPVDVLLLPKLASCALTTRIERRTSSTMAAIDPGHVLLVGGKTELGQVPRTYVANLGDGTITALPIGLGTRRLAPTVTRFDKGPDPVFASSAVVAGGADPDSNGPLRTAEVYLPGADGAIGDIAASKIELNEARAEHGAVVLASGETLLVGGRGATGLLATMEIIDPIASRARTTGLAILEVARKNPTVLRLASGEILVAGGEDAAGVPVPTLEWFAPDASRSTKRRRDLVASKRRMFVPLDTGGALAVISPDNPQATFKSVWVITADGALESGIPVQDLEEVRLFPAADASPLLFTGRRWLRWQPWFGAFQQLLDAPEPVLGSGGPATASIAAPDPGLAIWLEDRPDGSYVRAYRHGSRGPYASVPRPLLVKDEMSLAPDRLPSRDAYRFELERGLLLGPGASAFLPDVTFAKVTIELRVTATTPIVILRDDRGVELEVGGPFCPIGVAKETLTVTRDGARVTFVADGREVRECTRGVAENARVSIGLRGASGVESSGARNLFVRRD